VLHNFTIWATTSGLLGLLVLLTRGIPLESATATATATTTATATATTTMLLERRITIAAAAAAAHFGLHGLPVDLLLIVCTHDAKETNLKKNAYKGA
jgi:hypothetical protein